MGNVIAELERPRVPRLALGRPTSHQEDDEHARKSTPHPLADYHLRRQWVWNAPFLSRRVGVPFELRLTFQAYRDAPGNSGIQIRSRYDAGPDAPRGGWLDGPQIDVHPPRPWRIGLIYDETREERRWISPSLKDWNIDESYAPKQWRFKYADEEDGWNTLQIIAQGTRIQTILNGLVMTDFEGAGVLDNEAHHAHDVGLTGHIALQLHDGDEIHIRFKDIQLRDLSGR